MPSQVAQLPSIAQVPILLPLELFLAGQQVGIDKGEKFFRCNGLDVAVTVHAVFVNKHHVEAGTGDVQELPAERRKALNNPSCFMPQENAVAERRSHPVKVLV